MLSNGALKFSRVTLGDAGTYQCLAKNEAGVAVGRTKLILQGNVDFRSHRLEENGGFSVFIPLNQIVCHNMQLDTPNSYKQYF